MSKTNPTTPEAAMQNATEDIIRRSIKKARKRRRTIHISKTGRGKGVDILTLDPDTPEGRDNLQRFLNPVARHYTMYGFGAPEERNAVSWREINLPLGRRILVMVLVVLSFIMKGTPLKCKLYRVMGVHIGRNVEIMQGAWLDHFRPDLIFIGDNTLIGAYSRLSVHAYEGAGRFRFGLIEIGSDCTIGAGTGTGPILIEDGVRTLPGTTLSPYFPRIRSGAVVGYSPPPVKLPEPVQ
ncbi:MAG: DapH/DapD/GlmU-related protein [Bacteroidota bacterium]